MRCATPYGKCAPARFPCRHLGCPSRSHALSVDLVPQGDANFPARWRAIKTAFVKPLTIGEPRSPVMTSRGERGISQRRYREHTICDDRDFAAHMDNTHFIPVKHGLVAHRRIGRIRRFIGASTSGCILPGGGAAAMNRKRPANGSDAKRRKQAEDTTGWRTRFRFLCYNKVVHEWGCDAGGGAQIG